MTSRLARTAHDVRHLTFCTQCQNLADDRDTVQDFHPKCFHERHGDQAVIDLSLDERNQFRLCDIPPDLLRRLLDLL